MKKIIVILCLKLYRIFPGSMGWDYYHDILGIYISPAGNMQTWPKWCRPWMIRMGYWIRDRLFDYIKKNKDIAAEYHRAVVRKKNENSKDGSVYV